MKVCIDPGHGGYDPGAVGNGLREKDITLAIAMLLKLLLEQNGVEVIMTRDGDYAPGHLEGDLNGELNARVGIAEQNGVDLFISIHINAGGGTGAEVLIYGRGGNAERCANKVLPYIVQAGGWANRGVKVQNVLVLRETTMPAILTESGFIDTSDASKLANPNIIQSIAVAHARGICEYLDVTYHDAPAPTPAPSVLYRVRKSADDAKSQLAAFTNPDTALSSAKSLADLHKGEGYKVYDGSGNLVYTPQVGQPTPPPATNIPPQPVPQPTPTPAPFVGMSIIGESTITINQLEQFMHRRNPNAPFLAEIYAKMEGIYGVRADVAFCQMVKETKFQQFGGDVKPEQHNPAGIGATGGVQGSSFATWEQGIEAQVQHLYAYASTDPIPDGRAVYDPRFGLVKRGCAKFVEWLGIKENPEGRGWASDPGYGKSIIDDYIDVATLMPDTPPDRPVDSIPPVQTPAPAIGHGIIWDILSVMFRAIADLFKGWR